MNFKKNPQLFSTRLVKRSALLVSLTSCCVVLRVARLTDDADYDAGETPGNVPRPRSHFGNDHADNGLRTRSLTVLMMPINERIAMCKLIVIVMVLMNDFSDCGGGTILEDGIHPILGLGNPGQPATNFPTRGCSDDCPRLQLGMR
ncbi:unnamed protein product [Protopolystoma xenopodis]|uniref:Uncharacterized protein n=1 Tax=Protopolystoma xenopodis TaxID=117903 RepID=A0A448WLA4_9PLAT|nr:unnamed protein product [Protopolystoma xenopodis]